MSARAAVSLGSSATGSTYLAGYLGTAPDHVTELIVKEVVVSTVTCDGHRFQGIALGAGSEPTLGIPEYLATVFVSCVDGAPSYALDALAGGEEQQSVVVEPGGSRAACSTATACITPSG